MQHTETLMSELFCGHYKPLTDVVQVDKSVWLFCLWSQNSFRVGLPFREWPLYKSEGFRGLECTGYIELLYAHDYRILSQ
jgi:hypothetical protein